MKSAYESVWHTVNVTYVNIYSLCSVLPQSARHLENPLGMLKSKETFWNHGRDVLERDPGCDPCICFFINSALSKMLLYTNQQASQVDMI